MNIADHKCRQSAAWVYLVSSGGLFKIGITTSLRTRLSSLRNMSALEVTLVADCEVCCYEVAQFIERKLHDKCRSRRDHGEWFRFGESESRALSRMFRHPLVIRRRLGRFRLRSTSYRIRQIQSRLNRLIDDAINRPTGIEVQSATDFAELGTILRDRLLRIPHLMANE